MDLQKDIILLTKSAITGEKYTLSKDFDLDEIFKVAKRHSVIPMIYYGALNCGVDASNEKMQKTFFDICAHIAYNEKQMWEINNLFETFDKEKIAYIPLKGTILKPLYPKSEMRSMSDADILIKTNEHKKIKDLMLGLGYNLKVESDHEFVWNKGNIHIELHKRLIPSYNKDYFAYYGDGWQLAKLGENSKYYMDDEDHMIYIFTHFAKHYREAGIGIRHFVDLWVYKRSHPNMDEEYIKSELKKLQLYDFYNNILSTISFWFEDGEATEKSLFITETILNSSLYGNKDTYLLNTAVKSYSEEQGSGAVKRKKYITFLFLPYKRMCQKYPFLKKAPFLLPFMWIYRLFEALLFKRSKIKTYQEDFDKITEDKILDSKTALNFVGLDFNFKE